MAKSGFKSRPKHKGCLATAMQLNAVNAANALFKDVAPTKVDIKTQIHRKRWSKAHLGSGIVGVVLYRGTITRKGVRVLELVDVA